MEYLSISATQTTPEVVLLIEENKLVLRGNSYQSQIQHFYNYIIKSLKNLEFNNNFTVEFYFHLVNSSSLKFIITIIRLLSSKIESKGCLLQVMWHYQEYDIDTYQLGQDISGALGGGVAFSFIPLNDDAQFLTRSHIANSGNPGD
jgi:hypothetical protein